MTRGWQCWTRWIHFPRTTVVTVPDHVFLNLFCSCSLLRCSVPVAVSPLFFFSSVRFAGVVLLSPSSFSHFFSSDLPIYCISAVPRLPFFLSKVILSPLMTLSSLETSFSCVPRFPRRHSFMQSSFVTRGNYLRRWGSYWPFCYYYVHFFKMTHIFCPRLFVAKEWEILLHSVPTCLLFERIVYSLTRTYLEFDHQYSWILWPLRVRWLHDQCRTDPSWCHRH